MKLTKDNNIEPIFAIVGVGQENKIGFVGTAFFINTNGIFITAAHTFKDARDGSKLNFLGVVNGKCYPLHEIYRERKDMDEQVVPIHLDLFIGQLELGGKTSFFKLDLNELTAQDKILTEGFASKPYEALAVNYEQIQDLDDLWEQEESDILEEDTEEEDDSEVSNEGKLLKPIADLKEMTAEEEMLSRIYYSKLQAEFREKGMEDLFDYSSKGTFTNGFRFDLTRFNRNPNGYSGGPVTRDGHAVGMLISKNAAISAIYLKQKLEENAIEYSVAE